MWCAGGAREHVQLHVREVRQLDVLGASAGLQLRLRRQRLLRLRYAPAPVTASLVLASVSVSSRTSRSASMRYVRSRLGVWLARSALLRVREKGRTSGGERAHDDQRLEVHSASCGLPLRRNAHQRQATHGPLRERDQRGVTRRSCRSLAHSMYSEARRTLKNECPSRTCETSLKPATHLFNYMQRLK